MSILGLENVVGYSDELERAELDARLLERFATHAINRILAELQVPAGSTSRRRGSRVEARAGRCHRAAPARRLPPPAGVACHRSSRSWQRIVWQALDVVARVHACDTQGCFLSDVAVRRNQCRR